MDAYRRELENDLARLRHTRVQLRKRLEWFGRGHVWQDATETARLVREIQIILKGTDHEWNELCHKLGRRDLMVPRKPISLTLTASARAALARQAARDQAAQRSNVRKSLDAMPDSFKTGEDWLRYSREACRR
jgi:hypothetical protein